MRLHPHGDQSVYDAMVVMAQDWKMRYPLVDIHGNCGSEDGDPAAAMRYTEGRLSPYGELFLKDIEKNTVNFIPNFDESEKEPEILSGLFPSILLNGTSGIAVGMTCEFLPHNAKEVYSALDLTVKNAIEGKDTSIDDLIEIIKAPDFPTGGTVINPESIQKAYREGSGVCTVRSKYHIEPYGRQKYDSIVITEIPYGVNKMKMVSQIAQLAEEDEEFEKIKDVRDESDRNGLRVVIELKKDTQTNIMINRLLKRTQMQRNISVHHNALVNGRPTINLTLKDLIDDFLTHAATVCHNKAQYEYDKLAARLHIVEAILKALEDTEKTMELVKAKNRKEAISNLKEAYGFDDTQADAVASMRLYTLNEEDTDKLLNEQEALDKSVKRYHNIIVDQIELLKYLREELKDTYKKFFSKDARRTDISYESDDRDTIPDIDVIMAYTHNGYIKSLKLDEYNAQGRAGHGSTFKTKDDDFIENIFSMSTHDDIVVFTNQGRAYVLPAYKIPTVSKSSIGKTLSSYVTFKPDEKAIKLLAITEDDKDKALMFTSKKGFSKRMSLDDLPATASGAKVLSKKTDDDELVSVSLVNEDDDILMVTNLGHALRFPANKISVMGRQAVGSRSIRFKDENEFVASVISVNDSDIVTMIMQSGYAKKLNAADIPAKMNRGGIGVYMVSPVYRNSVGDFIFCGVLKPNQDIMIVTKEHKLIRVNEKAFSLAGRTARGLRAIKLEKRDEVASATIVDSAEEKEDKDEE